MSDKLEATTDDMDAMWGAIDRARATATSVNVPKAMLKRVLQDYQTTLTILNRPLGAGVRKIENT